MLFFGLPPAYREQFASTHTEILSHTRPQCLLLIIHEGSPFLVHSRVEISVSVCARDDGKLYGGDMCNV